MKSISNLYGIKISRDIIISDFGRTAALRYLSYFSDLEKARILQYLSSSSDFLDEYRRVAICLIGDLAYLKQTVLERYYKAILPFDNNILVGFDTSFPYDDLFNRITKLTFHQILLAIRLGHSRIRVVIPCNTLSPAGWFMKDMYAKLTTHSNSVSILSKDEMNLILENYENLDISFPTIPEIVLDFAEHESYKNLYILGTPDTCDLYQKVLLHSHSNIQIRLPSKEDQEIINRAIFNSIDGRIAKVEESAKEISELIVRPLRLIYPEIQFIEACTDLDLGIGLNSNDLYVKRLIHEIYDG